MILNLHGSCLITCTQGMGERGGREAWRMACVDSLAGGMTRKKASRPGTASF